MHHDVVQKKRGKTVSRLLNISKTTLYTRSDLGVLSIVSSMWRRARVTVLVPGGRRLPIVALYQ